MRKSILVLLGLLIMTMFLMGCAEESVESDDDEGNLAGEAFRAGKGCIPAECVYQDYAGGIKDCGHKDDGCGGTINCNYQAYAGGLECPSDYECLYQAYAGGVKGQCK